MFDALKGVSNGEDGKLKDHAARYMSTLRAMFSVQPYVEIWYCGRRAVPTAQ
jgi:hypothetical protein